MASFAADSWWENLEKQAQGAGLNVRWVLSREQVERNFGAAAPPQATPRTSGPGTASPAEIHPDYRRAVLLGSAGRLFWERFRASGDAPPGPEANPLDRFTERTVEGLLQSARVRDPTARAGYPFRHRHQIVPFQAFLGGSALLRGVPFGVSVHPRFGPWFAWRAVILLALEVAPTPLPQESPCQGCPAPCVGACPAGAVAREGFDWQSCGTFRLSGATCAAACPARRSCPVGPRYRYGKEQLAYHYRASLREIEAARAAAGRTP